LPAILKCQGGSGIIVVVVVVVTLNVIPDITDASSGNGDKPLPPGTNAVTTDDNDDNGVGAPTRDDDASQNGEPWDCVSDGVLNSCTMTVDVIVFALSVVTLHAGAEVGTAPRVVSSLPARFHLPA